MHARREANNDVNSTTFRPNRRWPHPSAKELSDARAGGRQRLHTLSVQIRYGDIDGRVRRIIRLSS